MRAITVLSKIYENRQDTEPKFYKVNIKSSYMQRNVEETGEFNFTLKELEYMCLNVTNIMTNAYLHLDKVMFIKEEEIKKEYLNDLQESQDTESIPTKFRDSTENFKLIKLSDGKYYYECEDNLESLYKLLLNMHQTIRINENCSFLPKIIIRGKNSDGYSAALMPSSKGSDFKYKYMTFLLDDIRNYLLAEDNSEISKLFTSKTARDFCKLYDLKYVKQKEMDNTENKNFEDLFIEKEEECLWNNCELTTEYAQEDIDNDIPPCATTMGLVTPLSFSSPTKEANNNSQGFLNSETTQESPDNDFKFVEINYEESYYECNDNFESLCEVIKHLQQNFPSDDKFITLPKVLLRDTNVNGYMAILTVFEKNKVHCSILDNMLDYFKENILPGSCKPTVYFSEQENKQFSRLYHVNYVKEKKCGLTHKDKFQNLFTKPISKYCAEKDDSYNLFDGKLRALVGLEFGESLIRNNLSRENILVAYQVALGKCDKAFMTYIVNKCIGRKKYTPNSLNNLINSDEYIQFAYERLNVLSKKLYMQHNQPYRNRKDNQMLMLDVTNKFNVGIKQLSKKERKIKDYLRCLRSDAYSRNSEDYYVIQNVFGDIIDDDSNDFDVNRMFRTIYLRPLLAIASRNKDSYKYFDFENNCKNIDIDKLINIAKCEIMSGDILYRNLKSNNGEQINYKSLKEFLKSSSVNAPTENNLYNYAEKRIDYLYSSIISLCSMTQISKRNPENNNCLEKFGLEVMLCVI